MRSITDSHDSPVASVIEASSSTTTNRLAPSAPKPAPSELPTSLPRMPPALATSLWNRRRCRKPVDAIRNPTMPTRRSAGPRSASAWPSFSMPNSAIHATAPSTTGSRKAT